MVAVSSKTVAASIRSRQKVWPRCRGRCRIWPGHLQRLRGSDGGTGSACIVEGKFACRQHADFCNLVEGTLAVDIEGLDVFNRVVKQIQPVG